MVLNSVFMSMVYSMLLDTLQTHVSYKLLLLMSLTHFAILYTKIYLAMERKTVAANIACEGNKLAYNVICSMSFDKLKEENIDSIANSVDNSIYNVTAYLFSITDLVLSISSSVMHYITIFMIAPFGMTFILLGNILLYLYIFAPKYNNLSEDQQSKIEDARNIWKQINSTNKNIYDNIIHLNGTVSVDRLIKYKMDLEEKYCSNEYSYGLLNFYTNIPTSIFIILLFAITDTTGQLKNLVILFTNLVHISKNINTFYEFVNDYYRFVSRFKKTKENLLMAQQNSMKKYNQIKISKNIIINKLNKKLQSDGRQDFNLHFDGHMQLSKGDVIIVEGESGHGKSTFFEILSGIIQSDNIDMVIDDNVVVPDNFRNLLSDRTYICQDYNKYVDMTASVYDIITDFKEKTHDDEILVWKLLDIVDMSDFAKNKLNCDIYCKIRDKVSGGEQIRLSLAKALFRLEKTNTAILILDEPDKGLPIKNVSTIIKNIIAVYGHSKIILMTMHRPEIYSDIEITKKIKVHHGEITVDNTYIV